MDCRTCQPTLLDLAHGELAPELAGAVREHVRGCPSCSAALDGLQRGITLSSELSWLEPPRSLRVNAMALAERHLRERAVASAQARASTRPRASIVKAVLDFIGRAVASPQVAMGTIFMLVVAVGLSQLPALQRSPSGHGVTVVSPDSEGEAAPSGGLAPAEPLDLAVDARSRRIRSREELAAASNAYAKQEEAAAEADSKGEQAAVAMAAEPPPPAEEKTKGDDDPLRRLGDVEDVIAQAPVPAADVSEYEFAERMASKASREGAGAATTSSTRRAKRAPAKEAPLGELAARDDFAEEAKAPASPAPSKPAAQQAPAAQAAPSNMDDLFDGALAGGGPKTQPSALSRARSTRSSNGCASALPLYEQAAKESATRGAALIELASCQRELGRIAAARSTLQQAALLPQVASRARSMLDELGPAPSKQAADVANEQPAAAPAP